MIRALQVAQKVLLIDPDGKIIRRYNDDRGNCCDKGYMAQINQIVMQLDDCNVH